MTDNILKKFEELIIDGCCPEFDSYWDSNIKKRVWTCSFYSQEDFVVGRDSKKTITSNNFYELVKKVSETLSRR